MFAEMGLIVVLQRLDEVKGIFSPLNQNGYLLIRTIIRTPFTSTYAHYLFSVVDLECDLMVPSCSSARPCPLLMFSTHPVSHGTSNGWITWLILDKIYCWCIFFTHSGGANVFKVNCGKQYIGNGNQPKTAALRDIEMHVLNCVEYYINSEV